MLEQWYYTCAQISINDFCLLPLYTKNNYRIAITPLDIFFRHDSDFLHDLTSQSTENCLETSVLQNALEFIEKRTHFWQNEDPLKGRKGKSDLMRRQKYCLYSGVRQDCWTNLDFQNYVEYDILSTSRKTKETLNRKRWNLFFC